MNLPTIYIVATEFPRLGLGSAGDVTCDRDAAYDQYADAIANMQPTRAFKVEFDAETNAFETATEVTEDFRAELERICDKRGIQTEVAA